MTKSKRKKGNTGKRYSIAERKRIIAFAEKIGRGGISRACKEFGVSYIALRRWMNNGVEGAGPRGRKGSKGASPALDGRKLRRFKTVLANVKSIKSQIAKLQAALKQLSK